MKKIGFIVLVMLLLAMSLTAQYDAGELLAGFEGFSSDMAQTLPLASNIGLNWNDASMKGFPHFGVGLTMGMVVIPSESFDTLNQYIGLSEFQKISEYIGMGAPLPVYSLDARLGIPVLPMDVGVKLGVVTPGMKDMAPVDFGFEYNLIGADVRWTVMEGKAFMPELSVGVGYNHLSGSITMDGPASQTIDVTSTGAGTNLNVGTSDIILEWESEVIDLKAQASMKLLMFNFSAGLGYSYGFSTAGGGFDAVVDLDGVALTPAEIDQLAAAGIDVSGSGLSVLSEVEGGTLRAFGGFGVQLAIVKFDLGAIYGIDSGTLGVSTNIRVQF